MPLPEFLWMISHCRNFITTSFHGFAFAVLFNKAKIFYKSNSRVTNLIQLLNIRIKNNTVLNYEQINLNIQNEKTKTKQFF